MASTQFVLYRTSDDSVDARRVRELEALSRTARETRARLSQGLQQVGVDFESRLGLLRDGMRKSRKLVSEHVKRRFVG